LGRVVTSERIERSIERKKRRLVGKFGGDRSQTRTFSFFFCIWRNMIAGCYIGVICRH
jgi:hypothetical protein